MTKKNSINALGKSLSLIPNQHHMSVDMPLIAQPSEKYSISLLVNNHVPKRQRKRAIHLPIATLHNFRLSI
tara:strand:+ start:295 stop:507 length:213 start_codon:yes stop_codon:yes gene_type:complete